MGNPRETGISGITGKVLNIRHANESERIDIAEMLKKQSKDSPDLSGSDVVVASQEASLLGFAVLTKDDEGLGGRLSLFEGKLHRGISRVMLGHLLEYSSVKRVAADRVAARHLRTMGFQRDMSARKEAGILRNERGERGRGSTFIFERVSNY